MEPQQSYWSNVQDKAHEIGARVGLVKPTVDEELKFGVEALKMAENQSKPQDVNENAKEKADTLTEDLKSKTDNMQEKTTQAWNETQNVLHEHGARTGVVEPTTSENIQFGVEKMETGIKDLKENVQEKGTQAWTVTQEKALEMNEKIKENVEQGREKVRETTEKGWLHELGARVGIVKPTVGEEIKFGAENVKENVDVGVEKAKENVDAGVEKVKENVDAGVEKVKEAKENLEEKATWKDYFHEQGARIGLVTPTLPEKVKFEAEKWKTADADG